MGGKITSPLSSPLPHLSTMAPVLPLPAVICPQIHLQFPSNSCCTDLVKHYFYESFLLHLQLAVTSQLTQSSPPSLGNLASIKHYPTKHLTCIYPAALQVTDLFIQLLC